MFGSSFDWYCMPDEPRLQPIKEPNKGPWRKVYGHRLTASLD